MKAIISEDITGISRAVRTEDGVFTFRKHDEELSKVLERYSMAHGSHSAHSSK